MITEKTIYTPRRNIGKKGERVLFILAGTYSPQGGMYEYLKAWIAQAQREGLCIAVACFSKVCEIFEPQLRVYRLFTRNSWRYNYHILSISSILKCGQIRKLQKDLEFAVRDFSPELIHFVDITLYSDYLVRTLLREGKAYRVQLTLHDPKFHNERISFIGKTLKKRLYSNLMRFARDNPCFFLHIHDKRLLKEVRFHKETKFLEIAHPLPQRFASRARPLWEKNTKGRFRIGFMGRIEPYKGLEDMLKGLHHFFSNSSISPECVEILIAGQGKIEKASWLTLPCRVVLKNHFLEDNEFHQEMANLDLLVLPYRESTQSGVAALAVAYGIPVVASRVGALDQLIINKVNGVLVTPESPVDLSTVLAQLVGNTELYSTLLNSARKMAGID